jgi:hypothetical protein
MHHQQPPQFQVMDVAPEYDQMPAAAAAAAAAAGGASDPLPGAYSDLSSPIARIEAAQESLLLLQLQVKLELQQVQAEQLQQRRQQLAAAQAWHASSAAADAAMSPIPGLDMPDSVSSAAIPAAYTAPLQCNVTSGCDRRVGGGSCILPVMRQQAGVSAAAAAAFYGSSSSSSSRTLPSIPSSNIQRSALSAALPTVDCTSTAAALPTSFRSTPSSYSAPLSAGNCGSSSCYSDALSPVSSCGTSFFGGGLMSPGMSGNPAGSSPAVLCAIAGAAASSGSVSPRAQAKIHELMMAQQMQLEIQDELLQLLSLGSSQLN